MFGAMCSVWCSALHVKPHTMFDHERSVRYHVRCGVSHSVQHHIQMRHAHLAVLCILHGAMHSLWHHMLSVVLCAVCGIVLSIWCQA